MFDRVAKLKQDYTDKYVIVDATQPELARFKGFTGQVKTVNMSGRALVQFDAWANIGWYDIDVDYLTVISEPLPKPDAKKEKPKRRRIPRPTAKLRRQPKLRRRPPRNQPRQNQPRLNQPARRRRPKSWPHCAPARGPLPRLPPLHPPPNRLPPLHPPPNRLPPNRQQPNRQQPNRPPPNRPASRHRQPRASSAPPKSWPPLGRKKMPPRPKPPRPRPPPNPTPLNPKLPKPK